MTISELNNLSDRECISVLWGDNVLEVIDNQTTTPMTMDEFLKHCTACGGNWGGMLLTGINDLYPAVYEAIPDNMGHFAWLAICTTMKLLNIESES